VPRCPDASASIGREGRVDQGSGIRRIVRIVGLC